jgi:hypothetical protein
MSDDWKVGDLALCVDANPDPVWVERAGLNYMKLEVGRTYCVIGLVDFDTAFPGLVIDGPASPRSCGSWQRDRFRKIRPDEHEDCEPEFVELLNRIKRKVEA